MHSVFSDQGCVSSLQSSPPLISSEKERSEPRSKRLSLSWLSTANIIFVTMAFVAPRAASYLVSPQSRRSMSSVASHSTLVPLLTPSRKLRTELLDTYHPGTGYYLLSYLPSTTQPPFKDFHQQNVENLEKKQKNNFTLAVGKAIDTLRDDVPTMMTEAPDLSIFSEDVVLTDANGNQIVKGLKSYGGFLEGLRWATRLTLSTPTIKVRQDASDQRKTIREFAVEEIATRLTPPCASFIYVFIPSKVLSLRYLDWRSEISVRFTVEVESPLGLEPLIFDAVSAYKLDSKGLIYEHRIDDMMRNHLFDRPPLIQVPQLWGKLASPLPTPF
mmetsp:Transcript_7327/g.15046  ORF Transcript_7327/g.15046 Transcript_7327/m.15046 type:complete len:329 (-) Transcript_7327:328-1314(-)